MIFLSFIFKISYNGAINLTSLKIYSEKNLKYFMDLMTN